MFNKQEHKEVHEQSNSSNIIRTGTSIEGNIETFGNIRVEGKLIGNLKTKSKAVFGQSSKIEGNVLAQNAEIEGHVSGTVEITEVLILKSTAVVDGDIITNKFIVESGAAFNGSCKMGVKTREITIGKEEEAPTLLKAQS
ncbi:MAG: polymer-forming cytoskeletal protein [Bacteroidota bacterium]